MILEKSVSSPFPMTSRCTSNAQPSITTAFPGVPQPVIIPKTTSGVTALLQVDNQLGILNSHFYTFLHVKDKLHKGTTV